MTGKFSRRRLFGGLLAALAGWLGGKAAGGTPAQPAPAPPPPPAAPIPWPPPNPCGPWGAGGVTTYVYDAGVPVLTGPACSTVSDGTGGTPTPADGTGSPGPDGPGEPTPEPPAGPEADGAPAGG